MVKFKNDKAISSIINTWDISVFCISNSSYTKLWGRIASRLFRIDCGIFINKWIFYDIADFYWSLKKYVINDGFNIRLS